MKKVIVLIILLILIIPSVSIAEDNLRIQDILDRGLISGDADTGNLRLEDPINRGEVAKMVVVAQGNEEIAKSLQMLESPFIDMDFNNWSNGYVNAAAVQGIIDGYPEKTFVPANDITYAEVITIMVRVLGGLDGLEESTESWELPYINKAMEIGILDEIEIIDYKEPAIRERVFEIVYNTIKIEEDRNYESYKGMVVSKISGLKVEIEKIDSENNETETISIPRRLGDTTNLLGMVIDINKDKENYVKDLSIDDTYSYIYGSPTFEEDKLLINHRYYNISNPLVYHNGEKYDYKDYYEKLSDKEERFTCDFARVTLKDKNVLFLDCYEFKNVGVVNEISKDGIEVYIETEKGEFEILKAFNPKDIILYTKKIGFTQIEIKDIEISDQLYFYDTESIIVGIDGLVKERED